MERHCVSSTAHLFLTLTKSLQKSCKTTWTPRRSSCSSARSHRSVSMDCRSLPSETEGCCTAYSCTPPSSTSWNTSDIASTPTISHAPVSKGVSPEHDGSAQPTSSGALTSSHASNTSDTDHGLDATLVAQEIQNRKTSSAKMATTDRQTDRKPALKEDEEAVTPSKKPCWCEEKAGNK